MFPRMAKEGAAILPCTADEMAPEEVPAAFPICCWEAEPPPPETACMEARRSALLGSAWREAEALPPGSACMETAASPLPCHEAAAALAMAAAEAADSCEA